MLHDGDGASSTLRLPHRRGSVVPAPVALARLVAIVLVAGGRLGERLLDLSRWRVGRRLHGLLRLAHGQLASPGQPGAGPGPRLVRFLAEQIYVKSRYSQLVHARIIIGVSVRRHRWLRVS